METMTLQFALTIDDYERAAGDLQRRQIGKTRGLITGILFALYFVLYFVEQIRQEGWGTLVCLVLILPFAFFLANSIPPLRYQRTGNDWRLSLPVTWEIRENELTVANDLSLMRHNWRAFNETLETKEDFYLFFAENKTQYLFIPKRIFSSPEQAGAFRALVKEKVKA